MFSNCVMFQLLSLYLFYFAFMYFIIILHLLLICIGKQQEE